MLICLRLQRHNKFGKIAKVHGSVSTKGYPQEWTAINAAELLQRGKEVEYVFKLTSIAHLDSMEVEAGKMGIYGQTLKASLN